MISFLDAAVANAPVALDRLDVIIEKMINFSLTAGKQILLALVVFIVGRFLISFLKRIFNRMLERRSVDPGVQTFLKSLVNLLLMLLLIVTVISTLGVNTTSIAALLASAGVAIGMALSGNLQNFAGGIIILLFKPYRVKDFVELQGVTGTVSEIQIFHTILKTVDNKVVYVPNGNASSSVIVNYSREENRRLEWTFGIDYGENVDRAQAAINKVLSADARILSTPAPFIAVSTLADSSVNIVVRVWTKTEDYWGVFHDVNRQVYDVFNQEKINFPYPQQTVHIVND